MKIISVDKEKKHVWLRADFWEIELLGYDVLENCPRTSLFFDNVLKEIEMQLMDILPNDFSYAIKWMIDKDKGWFIYEVKPYEERFREFITMEYRKKMIFSIIETLAN